MGDKMSTKSKQAALHAREMLQAKISLQSMVNKLMKQAKSKGYQVQVLPQVTRLLELGTFRTRDVNRMRDLVASPEKLQQYIFTVDAQTGVIISGAEALSRRTNYEKSAIYKGTSLPREFDVMMERTIEAVEDTFVDNSALIEFENFLSDVLTNPDVIADSVWQAAHPSWHLPSYKGDQYWARRQMVKDNIDNVYEMRAALQRLISAEGEQEAAKRISEHFSELQDAALKATVGYKSAAGAGLQAVLNIFLPKSIRNAAMMTSGMMSMQDAFDGQNIEYED